MNRLSEARLLFWTLRYLQPVQVRARLRRIMRRRWWSIRKRRAPSPARWQMVPFAPLYAGLGQLTAELASPELVRTLERAREISRGRFCFLNQSVDFGAAPRWNDPGRSQLWRYHLHYFDYVRDLLVWKAVEGSSEAYSTFRNLADSWRTDNSLIQGDGWHPYTLSLRIVNWTHALAGFRDELTADTEFGRRLVGSLAGQALVLSRDIEFDVRGNHILENLRALICASVAFDGKLPGSWYQPCLALLARELEEQIPSDGGHFERSPGYHLRVLQVCLEIALMIRRNRGTAPDWLEAALRRMLEYLPAILCPDGQVPLFKDTALGTAPSPDSLLQAGAVYFSDNRYSRSAEAGLYPVLLFGREALERMQEHRGGVSPKGPKTVRASDYFVMQDDSLGDYMVVDGGRPCPDYLPAHAHADLLSFELSVSGRRVIVDSGVYEYAAGPWRDYFRSTRAHNTVEVGNADQSEVYGSFRVGRRARAAGRFLIHGGTWSLFQSRHDGYMRLHPPVLHRRTIVWVEDGFWLVVDELSGSGNTHAANHIHFHPALSLREEAPALWRVSADNLSVWIGAFGHERTYFARGQTTPRRQGWYSEQFGKVTANTVLSLEWDSQLPVCFGYAVFKRAAGALELAAAADKRIVSVRHEQQTWTLRVPAQGVPTFG
jgi:uncharacterized heparinase superfamily protein